MICSLTVVSCRAEIRTQFFFTLALGSLYFYSTSISWSFTLWQTPGADTWIWQGLLRDLWTSESSESCERDRQVSNYSLAGRGKWKEAQGTEIQENIDCAHRVRIDWRRHAQRRKNWKGRKGEELLFQIERPAHAKPQRHETAWYFKGNTSSIEWFFRAEESRVDRDQLKGRSYWEQESSVLIKVGCYYLFLSAKSFPSNQSNMVCLQRFIQQKGTAVWELAHLANKCT